MNFVLNYLWIIFPLLNLRPKTYPRVGSYIYSVSFRKESAWALPWNGYSEPSGIRIWYTQNNTPEVSPLLSPGSTAAGETSASSCSGSLPSVLCLIQTWDSGSGFLSILPQTLRFYLWLVPWHPLNKLLLFLGFLVLTQVSGSDRWHMWVCPGLLLAIWLHPRRLSGLDITTPWGINPEQEPIWFHQIPGMNS